ncbi:hypothetical protein OF83DRAFT_1175720 [Amylostereum chailletii]|nr:hypothetical protein OF83DRAFT_1175720 [Amylostereum chailletii]
MASAGLLLRVPCTRAAPRSVLFLGAQRPALAHKHALQLTLVASRNLWGFGSNGSAQGQTASVSTPPPPASTFSEFDTTTAAASTRPPPPPPASCPTT